MVPDEMNVYVGRTKLDESEKSDRKFDSVYKWNSLFSQVNVCTVWWILGYCP